MKPKMYILIDFCLTCVIIKQSVLLIAKWYVAEFAV